MQPQYVGLSPTADPVPPSRPIIRERSAEKWDLPRLTYSAFDESVAVVLADLLASLGVGGVVPSVGDAKVSVDFVEVPGIDALRQVARVGGLEVEREGELVRFVPVKDLVQDFVVLRPGVERIEPVVAALQAVSGGNARVVPVGERLVVSGDPRALVKAAEFVDEMTTGTDAWLVEVRVFQVSKSMRESLGIDYNVQAAVGVSFDAGTGHRPAVSVPVFGARAAAAVEAALVASREGSHSKLVRSARLYCVEGSKASLLQGDVVPVARRAVSDQGTVTVIGHDRIETGFGLDVEVFRVPGGVRLDVRARLSAVVGFVEGAPITSESTVTSVVALGDRDWLLLSGFEAAGSESSQRGLPGRIGRWLGGVERDDDSESSVIVALQAVRVSNSDLLKAREP